MDIEQLLHEDESAYLDFKSEEYKFSGATEFQKSELLKDILAFANAWRRGTAYILLGVKEVKGGRSKPIGITNELDDAQLQEFINKKTQRPVNFTYKTYSIDNLKVGIIEIPVQQRPVYITKDYGKIKRNVVPIRIGSSTSEASPDEVVRMAKAEFSQNIELPNLKVALADTRKEALLGSNITITPTILDMSRFDEIADFEDPKLTDSYHPSSSIPNNYLPNPLGKIAREDYYRDLAIYEYAHKRTSYISFAITNTSKVTATDIMVSIVIDKNKKAFAMFNPSKLPDIPDSHDMNFMPPPIVHNNIAGQLLKKDNTFKFEELSESYRVNLTFRKVQPQQTVFCEKSVCIGSTKSHKINAKVTIYADNLPTPIESSLTITCNTKRETKPFKGLNNPATPPSSSNSTGLILGDLKIKVKKTNN